MLAVSPTRTAGSRLTRALTRALTHALTAPAGPERYLGHLDPRWTVDEVCADVVQVERPTPGNALLTLRPTRRWRGALAGQWVDVGVEVDGRCLRRPFSLTSSEHRDDGLVQIGVRAVPGGIVSPFLVHCARPGLRLRLSQAQGSFHLPADRPGGLLLVSGGSGLPPVLSLLRTLADEGSGATIDVLHHERTTSRLLGGPALQEAAADAGVRTVRVVETRRPGSSGESTHFDARAVADVDPAGTHVYVCGPAPLASAVSEWWHRVAGPEGAERLHVERYARPAAAVPAPPAATTSARRPTVRTVPPRRTAPVRPSAGLRLSEEQRTGFGVDLDAVRAEALALRGGPDLAAVRRSIALQRRLHVGGRALLLAGMLPPAWLVGTAALTVAEVLDARIAHDVRHGQYDWTGDPALSSSSPEAGPGGRLRAHLVLSLLSGPSAPAALAGTATAALVRAAWSSTVLACGADGTQPPDPVQRLLGPGAGGRLSPLLPRRLRPSVEHRLFPDLPERRRREAAGAVRDACARHGLPYEPPSASQHVAVAARRAARRALPGLRPRPARSDGRAMLEERAEQLPARQAETAQAS